MVLKIAFIVALCTITIAKDDKKWVWGDNNRDGSSARQYDRQHRYEVFENQGSFQNTGPYFERPPNQQRPIRPLGGPDFVPIDRPGGVYGGSTSGNYGNGHPYVDNESQNPGILTGPVPSWAQEGPYKEYDKCKCTEKFNCPGPGISYGHCDVGKQYCCYVTKPENQLGGPLPSRPQHSIENGVLAGPGGPVDGPNGFRPGGPVNGFRPNGGLRPGGGFGIGNRGDGPIGSRPVHSPDNGILVGPGGPFDRPFGGRPGGYGIGRNSKN